MERDACAGKRSARAAALMTGLGRMRHGARCVCGDCRAKTARRSVQSALNMPLDVQRNERAGTREKPGIVLHSNYYAAAMAILFLIACCPLRSLCLVTLLCFCRAER